MRVQITFWFGLLWLFLLASNAHAYPAHVTASTPLMLRVNGKIVNGPTIPKGRQIEVLATSPSGAFVQTDFAGKRGWVSAKNVEPLGGTRQPASLGGRGQTTASSNGMGSLSASLGIQGTNAGLGLGIVGLFNSPWSTGQWRFEGGPGFYYFPRAGGDSIYTGVSISVYELMGIVRGIYTLNSTMEVGADLGMVYMKANYPATVAGFTVTTSVADSWLGFLAGGVYTWSFASDWRLVTGARFLVADGSTFLLSGGIEYRF